MKYISGETDFRLKNTVVTLGKFDGLHIGHQMLIRHLEELKQDGYQTVMFTFSLHPMNLFSNREFKVIYTEEEKAKRLKELGIDVLIAYPFTNETACMEAEQFIRDVLVKQLDVKYIIVGKDYRFGHNRRGDVTMLEQYAKTYGYEVIAYDKISYDGEIVSSSRVRKAIEEGDMELVHNLLGKPFSVVGTVVHGNQIGRTLGMPTTNLLPPQDKLLPPNGVYASKVNYNGKSYNSVTNIGCKPTIGDYQKGVETYIFDFDEDIYDKTIEVELLVFERKEQKFSSLDELQATMQNDIVFAQEVLRG